MGPVLRNTIDATIKYFAACFKEPARVFPALPISITPADGHLQNDPRIVYEKIPTAKKTEDFFTKLLYGELHKKMKGKL